MAANYSQYTDHNEIGGVSVGLEDAKLAAADSVDEVAATDCVLMKDASGNPVKILKEDFNEAVRDALGSILSYNELGASIGRVAALGSSDNDFGSISTSDLASLLGGLIKFSDLNRYEAGDGINMDLNDAPDGCIIFSFQASGNRPPISSNKNGVCLTFSVCYAGNTVQHKIQFACDEDAQAVYYRLYWAGWKTWTQL